ncbi:hypothetical protein [Streptomyces botrytidirepellens]|uniref:Uncharacterized protein n=1 Tax=Streptomyces botrytidirepellens TaxID=2486417 RepID=A0A3M8WE05_9ACTN|nr:hypothetical protein [Streptomyces botrytidirepellens]RNG28316.1 hypothetical protein EEJ42_12230 [Streptomyces botrytidirepellens]
MRLFLPPGLHRIVHDGSRDAAERAELVLSHIGHGNLPHDSAWNTTEHAAFEDLFREQLLSTEPQRPATHLTFHVLPLRDQDLPLHDVKATWVRFIDSPGIEVQLAGMSWRASQRPSVNHSAVFDPPVDAAIAPQRSKDTSSPNHDHAMRRLTYRARFSDIGDLLPGQAPRRTEEASPYAGREADIRAMGARLQKGIAERAAGQPGAASGQQAPTDHHVHQQDPGQQTPRIR